MVPRNRALRILVALALSHLAGSRCAADEAVRPEGQTVAGTLRTEKDGRLHFRAKDTGAEIPLAEIQDVRFAEARPHPSLFGAPLRMHFGRDQGVTGEVLDLDDKSVNVRTFWSNRVQLPRRALVAITQLPGRVTIFHEDFDADLVRLKLTGSPKLDDKEQVSGRRSLRLDAIGQSASYTLSSPLEAGRIGVNFRTVAEYSGARWLMEADFSGKQTVRMILAGDDSYSVESDLAAAENRSIKRSPDWHRLSVRFQADYLIVGVDDRLLWESAKSGPGGPLRSVRLNCVAREPGATARAAVYFDDLSIVKLVEELRHARGDRNQDELWLLGGDQLFGRVARADRRQIEIHGRFGKRSLPWSALRGFFPKDEATDKQTGEEQQVRVWLRNGFSESDELECILRDLDDRQLVLRHAVFGDLTLDRSRLHRLRPRAGGRVEQSR
jgi:hypothetical protein